MTLPVNLCEMDAKQPQPPLSSLQPASDQSKPSLPQPIANVRHRLEPNLKGDRLNFMLLLLLYTMQGFPMGLTSAIPILLQDKNSGSYQDQALFSLVLWPFSLKLLWAPLVDALYVQRIGRRKSWLVPVQYVMGICFCYMAQDIDDLLPETGKPDITMLIYMFFTANFLAATQDIVIDGWALTMLKSNNLGHASTCNTAGQTIGVTIGSVFSVLLTSEDFCNRYMRSSPDIGGIVTMKDILYTWGILFILVTTLIAIFKNEKDYSLEDDHVRLNVIQNYSLLWDILKLPTIQLLAIALLTSRIGFCVTDSVTSLKLIDAGVSKDDIAIISTSMSVVKIFIPLMASKYTTGPKPMSIYLRATAMKLIWNIACILLIYFTPQYIDANKVEDTPLIFYTILIFILFIDEILYYIMFVAMMAFFLRISDSRFGGTYITFLNTVINLGTAWSSTVALGMIDVLTFEKCSTDFRNDCSTTDMRDACEDFGGECTVTVNGFYAGTLLSMFFGFVWYGIFKDILKRLQHRNVSHWVVNMKRWSSDNIDGSISITISRQC